MKLTAKLVFLVTSGFILIILIDSYFLIQREKDLIESGQLNFQFDLVQSMAPFIDASPSFSKFTKLNENQFNDSLQMYKNYKFAGEDFWVLQSSENVKIRYKSKSDLYLEYNDAVTTDRTITDIYKRTIAVIIITILISFIFTTFIGVSVIGRPVKKILSKIDQIKSKKYDDFLVLKNSNELSDIAHALNEMSLEIDEAYRTIENENKEKLEYIKQLRHAERLTTIGALTSGIAHELGTPLNVILGHCSFIKTHNENEKTANSLITIQKQVDKMSSLIKNLLSFSQKSNLQKASNDLGLILKDCVQLLDHKLKNKQIDVSLNADTGIMIDCDKQKIEQVIINILMNSIQVLDEKGKIKISCSEKIERTFKKKKSSFYMVSLADNGPGIKKEDINKIFDPFFTTKDVGQGTGLGLSISLGIIEEHGGWIEVDSKEGQGAVFYVYLPVLKENDAS